MAASSRSETIRLFLRIFEIRDASRRPTGSNPGLVEMTCSRLSSRSSAPHPSSRRNLSRRAAIKFPRGLGLGRGLSPMTWQAPQMVYRVILMPKPEGFFLREKKSIEKFCNRVLRNVIPSQAGVGFASRVLSPIVNGRTLKR